MEFNIKNKLNSKILNFQKLDSSFRWVFADELLHKSCLIKKSSSNWGFYGNIVNKIIRFSSLFKLSLFFVGLIGFTQLLYIYLYKSYWEIRSLRGKDFPNEINYQFLYFSFGAANEELIFNKYCSKKKKDVKRFDQNDIKDLAKYQKLSFRKLILSLINSINDIRNAIKHNPELSLYSNNQLLTSVSKRLAYYSFMKLWFRELNRNNPDLKEICFSNADIAAYAAISVNFKTRYIQHGLISKLIVFPEFNIFESLSDEEYNYFKFRFPKAQIKIQAKREIKITPKYPPNILIVSSPEIQNLNKDFLNSLKRFQSLGCKIFIRLHPREQFRNSVWAKNSLPFTFYLVERELSFTKVLEEISPRLTFLWHSTAILDLLRRGLIVSSFCENSNSDYFVYPIEKYTLNFRENRNLINKILFD